MPTEASASERIAVTSAKARGPSPPPPASAGSVTPRRPAAPSASMASLEKLASLSCATAAGAKVFSAISFAREVAVWRSMAAGVSRILARVYGRVPPRIGRLQSARWYERARPGLGDGFLVALDD